MKVVRETGDPRVARVWVVDLGGRRVECCESLPDPLGIAEKWVLIVSTLEGCPVRCSFCDAGIRYRGRLSADQILAQVRFMLQARPGGALPSTRKLKVQLSRMGEPALNPAVIDALDGLVATVPAEVRGGVVVGCLSTVAPRGRDAFFEALRDVKERRFPGCFQLQLSVHSTDERVRDWLMPVRKLALPELARLGERFRASGDKKVTLNFAASPEIPVDPRRAAELFDPRAFLVKITPVNPTRRAAESALTSNDLAHVARLGEAFARAGFDALPSIGNLAENEIGSNCGQLLHAEEDACRRHR